MRLNERTELLLVALARTSMAVCTRGASASWAAAAAMRAASTRRLEWVMVAEVWTRGHGGDWRGTGVRSTPTLSTKTPGDGAPDMEPVFLLFLFTFPSDYLQISENGSYSGLSICQKGHSGIFADMKYQLPSVNMQGATSNMARRSGGGAEYPCNHDTEHNLRDTSRRAARSAPPSEPRFLLLYDEYSLLNGLQLLARQNTRQYEESDNCFYS